MATTKPTPDDPAAATAAQRAGNQELAPDQIAGETGEQPWPGRDLGAMHDPRRADRKDVPGATEGGEAPADIAEGEAGVRGMESPGAEHGRDRPGRRE